MKEHIDQIRKLLLYIKEKNTAKETDSFDRKKIAIPIRAGVC
jgi:ribosomal protein S15P/S13E